MLTVIKAGQSFLRQGESDGLTFARRQHDFREGFEFFFGPVQPRLEVAHVELHDLLPAALPAIGHIDGDPKRLARLYLLRAQTQGAVVEGRI